jgi:hypothetical protein
LPPSCIASSTLAAGSLVAPPSLVRRRLRLSFASRLPCWLVVASPLVTSPPPCVAPLSTVHLSHGSLLCLSSEPPPLVVSALHCQQAPCIASASYGLPLLPPPVISWRLLSLAGRLIVTSWRCLHCPYRCCPHLAIVLFVTPSANGQRAVAPVLAFDAARQGHCSVPAFIATPNKKWPVLPHDSVS